MAEFICRLGTPAGEVVTRTIEATGIHEARARLEREGFRVFNVAPPRTSGVAALTRRRGRGPPPQRLSPLQTTRPPPPPPRFSLSPGGAGPAETEPHQRDCVRGSATSRNRS